MQRCLACSVVLAVALLALLVPLSARAADPAGPSTPVNPPWLESLTNKVTTGCNVWTGTDYYSDGTYSTRVGVCYISCSQFDFIDPTFGTGATCTGVSSAYTIRRYSYCPNGCR
jgi:hypothetical protein